MQRLFLSIPLSNQVKNQIAPEIERFKKSISDWEITWVAPENLHLTRVFFGWVKKEQIESLITEIGRAVSDFPSFKITTGKVSAKRWPIWLEIEQGREELNRLAEELVHQLTIKGSLEEGRGFYPRSEEHTSELQPRLHIACGLL